MIKNVSWQFSSREQAAVADWVKSGKLLHVMRDNPQHGTEILAGLWGIYQPPAVKGTFTLYFQEIIDMSWEGSDQDLLRVSCSSQY